MQLVLVRHAQPEWIKDGRNVDNPPLTELGHRQAERTAAALAGERFDRIIVSPLVRAQQTVAPIAEALGLAPETHDWLEELRNPEWDGTQHDVERIFAEARRRPAEAHWEGLEGGESFRDFHQRVARGLLGWLGDHGVSRRDGDLPLWDVPDPDARTLVVAHAGTNSVLLTALLGVAPVPWEWERFVMHHSSVSETMPLEIADGRSYSLLRLSDVRHLGPDEVTR